MRRIPVLVLNTTATALLCVLTLACSAPEPEEVEEPRAALEIDPAYAEEVESFRAEVDESLRQPDSWLSLAGLFWLEEGEQSLGSAPENDIVFPKKAPAKIGTLSRQGDEVRFSAEPGVAVTQGEDTEPVTELVLAPDSSGEPTVLTQGSFDFYLIERTGRFGIRLKDREHPALTAFTGVEHFPIRPQWRIKARFEPYDPPKPVKIPNIIGTEFDDTSPGALVFTVDGQEYRLEPTGNTEQGLFLVFGDATNGHETYGGGRFLAVDPPADDGSIVVDFNKAYNPPCVFSAFATCPLPPRQNRLAIPVEAGALMYGEDPHATGASAR